MQSEVERLAAKDSVIDRWVPFPFFSVSYATVVLATRVYYIRYHTVFNALSKVFNNSAMTTMWFH